MKLYLYTLNPHAARPIKLAEVRRVVERACRYVEVSANHQVVFAEDKGQARLLGTPTIDFSFADFGGVEDTAQWVMPRAGVFEIRFNYHLSWATRNHDLYTHAVHELAHVLGMYPRLMSGASYHNPDAWSVMHERPMTSKFTETDLGTLRYLTHPDSKIPRMKYQLLIVALLFTLPSCGVIIGLRQTSPNRKPPGIITQWWMEQNQHKNSRPN